MKIKNKNIGYFLVNKRVFSLFRKAELFCDKNGLGVDEYIRSESPDVLKEAKEICFNVLPILYDIKESIQEEYDNQLVVCDKVVDEFKELETKRDLLRSYKEQQVHEGIGELRGILKAIRIIDEQILVHEQVRRLH
jgi:hypothetical protein